MVSVTALRNLRLLLFLIYIYILEKLLLAIWRKDRSGVKRDVLRFQE